MTLIIECECKPEFSFHYKVLAGQVVEACLEAEDFPYEAEIALTLVDNDTIRRINRENRDIDAATDVLSFPMLTYPGGGDFSTLDDQVEDCVNPDTGEVLLGDIVISVDKVREQAKAYGHKEKREYAFLITHSMLHLMGYDHLEADEAAEMEARQRQILEDLGITR